MIGAAEKITAAIVSTITHSTSPQLTAAWFQRSFAPMAALGAALALLVTLIALTSAAARRDPAALAGTLTGILRAGLGTGLLIALTTLALQISDAISADVIRTSHQTFWSQVGHAWGSSGFGGFGSSALAMLMAIIQVIAGVLVWLELAVRNAAIYLAVLFFPVALAASIWPGLAGWTSRLGAAAVPVRDPQAGHADRARVRRQRGARGTVAQRQPGLVGRNDHRRDHDLRARSDGAVGADADRRCGLRVRSDRRRCSRGRRTRAQRRCRDARPGRRPGARRRRARRRRARCRRRRDPRCRQQSSRRRIRRLGRAAGGGGGGGGGPSGPSGDSPSVPSGGGSAPESERRRSGTRAARAIGACRPSGRRHGGSDAAGSGRAGSWTDRRRRALGAPTAALARARTPAAGGSSGGDDARALAEAVSLGVGPPAPTSAGRSRRRSAAASPDQLSAAEARSGHLRPADDQPLHGCARVSADLLRRADVRRELRDDVSLRAASERRVHSRPADPAARRADHLRAHSRSRRCRAGGFGALALAIAIAGLVASVVIVPVRGQTLDQWAPIVVRFLIAARPVSVPRPGRAAPGTS